ncbi:GGDEF domain-containing protein [Nocardiopsis suaedae]|uniref:GGDEF domain-containing protein n=1 Tax=Nocardiopsis suaedae TaxID=3018444 RepID=UPI0038CDBDFE
MAVAERCVTPCTRSLARKVRGWPVFRQAPPMLAFMGAVFLMALVALLFAAAAAPFRIRDALLFSAMVLCAALCVEAMRRLGTPSGLTRDLFGAWWIPTLLLLPPLYSLLIPIPVYLLLQFRIRRTMVHRRVFNAASVAIAGAASSWLFHKVAGIPAEEAERAVPEVLFTPSGALLAFVCCALFTVLNTAVITVAVRLSAPDAPWRRLLWDREAVTVDSVELCVGITVAILSGLSVLLLAIALPPVLLLQRSLLYQQLQAAARNDPKTGLLNAATWECEAGTVIEQARRDRLQAAVLIIDIDHFKRVNDTYGHLVGDEILHAVATTLDGQLRPRDVIGRFGGEEFVVLLPETDLADACKVAERLRRRVSALRPLVDGVPIDVTVSVGVALLHVHGDDLVDLMALADLALYRAKDAGRDRVRLPVTGEGLVPGQKRGDQAPARRTARGS